MLFFDPGDVVLALQIKPELILRRSAADSSYSLA
jgi:hypothetical protein